MLENTCMVEIAAYFQRDKSTLISVGPSTERVTEYGTGLLSLSPLPFHAIVIIYPMSLIRELI